MADGVVYTGFDPAFGDPLNRLIALAKARGYNPQLISGRRDAYGWPGMKGQSQAELYSQLGKPGGPKAAAPPGYSPHQYGVAGDVAGLPQSVLEQLASEVGLRAIHSDPNHLELPNWQKTVATQPPMTAWNESNPANVPSRMALNMEAGGPPGTKINGQAPIPGALAETGPESSNATGGGSARPGQPMDNRQIVFNRLVGAGISPQVALGAMWSLGGESGGALNTGAINPKDPGGAVGFGQWTGGSGRRQALEALAKANGTPWTDINTQADHLINELTNKDYSTYQPGVFDALKGAKTSEEGARIWTSQFERPLKDNSDARIKNGAQVGSLDDQGNFVPGTAKAAIAAGPSSTGPRDATASAPLPGQASADNQSLFGRFTQGPIDPATGKPTPGAVTPMAQIADAILNNTKNTQAKVDAAGPERTALSDMPAPMARNVSPMGGAMLPNVAQTYGQTLNSFARPLSYDATPPQAPQMAPAGFRGSFGPQAQGVSLNSLPPLPQGFPGQIRPLTLDEYGYQGAGYAS